MARYIDADKFLEELEKQICDDCIDEVCGACGVGCARAIARELPTADVVPKSEVEELMRENESLAKTVNEASSLIHKLRSKVETEVARGIFAEIETVLCYSVYSRINANGTITPKRSDDFHIRRDDYNAIKKKYTEEK